MTIRNPMKKILSLIVIASALLAAGISSAADEKAAAPAKCTPNVTGTWNFTVVLSEGSGNPVFTFKQDGEKLTGHYQGAFGEADVTGTIKACDITFCFKIGDQPEPVTYSGTVEGDSMKGKVTFGSYGGGTFTGTKEAKK
jgi:hypothetical protein